MVQQKQQYRTYKEVHFKDLKNKKFHSISIGKPIPGMKIKLLNNGKFSRKRGEIIIYGNQVADGYLNKKKIRTNSSFQKNKSYFKTEITDF